MKSNLKKYLLVTFSLFGFLLLPQISHAATLYLTPNLGSFSVGSTISVSIKTNTQGTAVNTAEANITYSTDTLELTRVSQGGTFYLASPGSPSKGTGTAYFGGGLPTPGYNGAGGTLGTLVFRAKAVGNASIDVSNGKVLLNDGNGTDAMQGTTSARFTITPPPVGGVVVSSTTHPDSAKWYAASTVVLNWNRPSGVYGYSFELDRSPSTTPDDTLDTTVTTNKSYDNLTDGVWYFHIRARGQTTGFGQTTHFAIQTDLTPPDQFEVKVSDDNTANPTLTFETKDATSGVDHYQISVGTKIVEENAKSPYTLSVSNGNQTIKVTAVDKAGNARDASTKVTVAGAAQVSRFPSGTLTLPTYLVLLMNFIILLLLAYIAWLLSRRKKRGEPDTALRELQDEVDETLEKLRKDLDKRLLTMNSDRGTKISKAVSADISKTRSKIDANIDRARKR